MQIITALIPNSVFTSIKGKANTQEVWDTLKALYKGQTIMILVNLSQQLQNMHCGEEDNIHKHIDKLANLCKQIATMGKSVPENEYTSILMGLLPTSYASMLGSIAASAEMSRVAVSPAIIIKLAQDKYDC
jgi:gag-polypeptide of LTR copia-type